MALKQITFHFLPELCKCSHRSAGRLFHILAPATTKILVPSPVLAPVTTGSAD